MGYMDNVYKILVGKPEDKCPRRSWRIILKWISEE
jgi:hypothetical protein